MNDAKLNDEKPLNAKIKRCLEEFDELNSLSHNTKDQTIYSGVRRINRIGFLKKERKLMPQNSQNDLRFSNKKLKHILLLMFKKGGQRIPCEGLQ